METKEKYFNVIRLHRDDFTNLGFNAEKLSDKELEDIAKRIGEILIENYYWDSIAYFADYYNLPIYEPEIVE